jgi:hypothetical protein
MRIQISRVLDLIKALLVEVGETLEIHHRLIEHIGIARTAQIEHSHLNLIALGVLSINGSIINAICVRVAHVGLFARRENHQLLLAIVLRIHPKLGAGKLNGIRQARSASRRRGE